MQHSMHIAVDQNQVSTSYFAHFWIRDAHRFRMYKGLEPQLFAHQ